MSSTAATRSTALASQPLYSVPYLCWLTHRLDTGSAGVHRSTLPVLEEDQGRVYGGYEPQEHVHKVNPDSTLHADLSSLLRGRFGTDVDIAEDAKQSSPKDEEKPVPTECPVALDEGDAVDEAGYGRE